MRLRLNILEEVKSQLGEQLPGSLEAIRKAVSKFYKKDISTSEMFDLMKNGKLLAKDILPLLGEEFSKMARTGDALRVALTSLSTVQQRMNTSFREMINNVYKGGLAEGLSKLYTTLDKMFWVLSQGDSGLGKFLKGFFEGARESVEWLWDHLTLLRIMLEEEFGMKGADMELLGKAAYYASIILALNTISGLMKWLISAPLLNGLATLAGKILGVGAATETVAAAQVTANAAVAASTSSGWIAMLLSQSKLLLAALAPVAAAVAAIAAAAAVLNLAQNKYDSMSPTQQADWQQKMTQLNTRSTLMSSGAGGSMLPNTNPYAPMMQAVADTNRQLQETIINAPPLRVDVRVEESELSKFIKFRVDEGIQRQVQSILPTGAPSLVTK